LAANRNLKILYKGILDRIFEYKKLGLSLDPVDTNLGLKDNTGGKKIAQFSWSSNDKEANYFPKTTRRSAKYAERAEQYSKIN
jgi:hypothetical protein